MLLTSSNFLPIETLLQIILNKYFANSYCLAFVSEQSLMFSVNISSLYIVPNATRNLEDQLLEAYEMGCSDYIIYLQDFEKFMLAFDKVNQISNTRRSDRKLIFLPHINDEKSGHVLMNILEFKKIKFVANVLLVLPTNELDCVSFDLVTHNFYGRDDKIHQPVYLDRWNSCTGYFDNNSNLFPYNMSNLFGKTIKVACTMYKPYILLDLDPSVAPQGRDGTEIRLMNEFCRWVNCSIEIVRDGGYRWGEIYNNLTGVGVLGHLMEDRADIALTALYPWYEEYLVFDFTAATVSSWVYCAAPSPKLLPSWQIPLQPFSWYMWLAVIFTFIYASVGLIIAQQGSTNQVFLYAFGMLITQSHKDAGSTWRIRSITAWLLLTGLVIDNAYGGGLASVFTVPKYEKSIDTVQDFVDRRMEWGATFDAWIFSLTLSPDPLLQQVVKQFRLKSAEELVKESRKGTMAFPVEILSSGYTAIPEYITKDVMLDLTLMRENFYYGHCVIMLRKSSPFTEKINDFIGKLHEGGLLLTWETQMSIKYLNYEVQQAVRLSRNKKNVDELKPLGLRHFVGVFIGYAIGVAISIVIFILEVLVQKGKRAAQDLSLVGIHA